MPLHRTIGISLALMMISAGASAQTTTKSTAQDPVHAVKPEEAHSRTARARGRHAAQRRFARRRVVRRYAPPRPRVLLASAPAAEPKDRIASAGPGGRRATGIAAWYDLQGRRTASGDPFSGVRLTAAHRTLPLHSYARVTDLENGRSVVVEINDRGPWKRGLMIDLSQGAAQRLQMLGAGLARVAVEPLADVPPAASAPQPALSYAEAAPAAPAIKPMLVAYHPDPPPTAPAAPPASRPQAQQDALLHQNLQGFQ